jgi:hypothetical protein
MLVAFSPFFSVSRFIGEKKAAWRTRPEKLEFVLSITSYGLVLADTGYGLLDENKGVSALLQRREPGEKRNTCFNPKVS